MTIRAVFFDLDDTLCDTNSSRHERARLVASRIVQDHSHLDIGELAGRILETDPVYGWPKGTKRCCRNSASRTQTRGVRRAGSGSLMAALTYYVQHLAQLRPSKN